MVGRKEDAMANQRPNPTHPEARDGRDAVDVPEKVNEVVGDAAEKATQVATEAKDQAREVAGDIRAQARDVLAQTRTEVLQQADEGTKRVAGGVRALRDQILALREGRPEDAGPIGGYADQAQRKMDELASRLDRGGVDGVASDLSRFARRRPGVFLLACAGAGFALARLVRTQVSSSQDPASRPAASGTPLPARSPAGMTTSGSAVPAAVAVESSRPS
jgi:hypothetical protein